MVLANPFATMDLRVASSNCVRRMSAFSLRSLRGRGEEVLTVTVHIFRVVQARCPIFAFDCQVKKVCLSAQKTLPGVSAALG